MKRFLGNCRGFAAGPFLLEVANMPRSACRARGLRNADGARNIAAHAIRGPRAAMTRKPLLLAALLLGLVSAAFAQRNEQRGGHQQQAGPRPALFETLVRCRA